MSISINVEIERISNGFIVSEIGSKEKTFYPSMAEFVSLRLEEAIADEDKYFREHAAEGSVSCFSLNYGDKTDCLNAD